MNRITIPLSQFDPEIHAAIKNEERRQSTGLELIASENFTYQAVLEATGSVFTNKYAEGYPGRRYYGGCEFVDVVENLAIERAKKLFGAEHVNVQPHSGSQANMAVYLTILKPGDTMLGMNLSHGGHLTHGHPLNFSGKYYRIVPYGVRKDTEVIDYDELARLAREHQPKLIVVGASAYPRTIDFERISKTAKETGAMMMVDIAHIAGLVAAGEHPSPVPYAEFVTSTTHKTLRGPRSGMVMCRETFAKDLNRSVFPEMQGGPLVHVIAAKAVCFKEAATDEFRDVHSAGRPKCKNAGREDCIAKIPDCVRRNGHAPDAGGRFFKRHQRQAGRTGPRQGRNHGQQERDSVRSEPAIDAKRDPHRHAGADHSRNEGSGNGSHRGLDRGGAGQNQRRERAEESAAGSRRVLREDFRLYQ